MTWQTTIQGDRLNPPQQGMSCEWCSEPATDSRSLLRKVKGKRGAAVPSGQHVYFCEAHREAAARLVEGALAR